MAVRRDRQRAPRPSSRMHARKFLTPQQRACLPCNFGGDDHPSRNARHDENACSREVLSACAAVGGGAGARTRAGPCVEVLAFVPLTIRAWRRTARRSGSEFSARSLIHFDHACFSIHARSATENVRVCRTGDDPDRALLHRFAPSGGPLAPVKRLQIPVESRRRADVKPRSSFSLGVLTAVLPPTEASIAQAASSALARTRCRASKQRRRSPPDHLRPRLRARPPRRFVRVCSRRKRRARVRRS